MNSTSPFVYSHTRRDDKETRKSFVGNTKQRSQGCAGPSPHGQHCR